MRADDQGMKPILLVEEITDVDKEGGLHHIVEFELSDAAIRVNGGGVQFFVKPHWSDRASKCDLYVNETEGPFEVWQLSQRGLITLFFG